MAWWNDDDDYDYCLHACHQCDCKAHKRYYNELSSDEKKINHLYSAVITCKAYTFRRLIQQLNLQQRMYEPFKYVSHSSRRRIKYANIAERLRDVGRYDLLELLPEYAQLQQFPKEIAGIIPAIEI